jgi:FMN phosphatase YigB (HAD superfamily)
MIRTFLFDMGNVLTRFSHITMCQQIGQLCGLSGEATFKLLIDSGLQWEFERGRITEQEFRDRLSQLVERPLDLAALRKASSDIFDPIVEMKPILWSLKRQGYRLVLLSNTTVSHFDWIKGRYDFLVPFDHCIVSFEAGAMKPDSPIYEAALAAIHCDPGEAFYTDDIPEYVAKGREYGFQAEVFTGPADLLSHLAARGIRV